MKTFAKLLLRNRLATFGAVTLVTITTLTLITPILPLHPPNDTNTAQRFLKPLNPKHPLGTDHLGRDLLSRLLHGTGLSLAVGITAALIAGTIGATIGIIAGYTGGRTDNIAMRGIDMLMAFPYILLALAIVAVLGPGLLNALIAVAIVNIPFFARNIRGVTVGIVHREYIDAAKLAGMGNIRIILTEVLPNVMPVIVIAMSTTVGWMILETAGLSFLGLGSQPPQADLGSMLGEARAALIVAPHTSIIPGAMILLIVMSMNLLGDGVRDATDPRLRSGTLAKPMPATLAKRGAVPEPSDKHLLQIDSLETHFLIGKRTSRAVNQVSLHLRQGECLGIIGESGSGKSVTALSVTGLVASPPGIITGGAVRLDGQDLVGAPYEILRDIRGRRVAYVFQDPTATLHPLHRVGDQIAEAIRAHGAADRSAAYARALKLLGDVHIPNPAARARALPHELSGGMRQRVSIAMALANNPDIIIADEPTTALDVTIQAQILSLLDELRRERGLSILFITHDFGVVSQLCDRVAVMYAGQVVETGPTRQVLESPAHPYTRRLIRCVPEPGGGQRKLEAIPGLPPTPDRLPDGCAFASRCDGAREACRSGRIPLEGDARRVRCLFPEAEI